MIDYKDISERQKDNIIATLVDFVNENKISNSIDYYQNVADELKIDTLDELVKIINEI